MRVSRRDEESDYCTLLRRRRLFTSRNICRKALSKTKLPVPLHRQPLRSGQIVENAIRARSSARSSTKAL